MTNKPTHKQTNTTHVPRRSVPPLLLTLAPSLPSLLHSPSQLIAFVMPPLLDELSSRQCMLAWPTTAPKASKVHIWTARGIAVFGVAATILGIVTSF